jgi:hypothetical protein
MTARESTQSHGPASLFYAFYIGAATGGVYLSQLLISLTLSEIS